MLKPRLSTVVSHDLEKLRNEVMTCTDNTKSYGLVKSR